jgi:hypothetical protein
MTAFPAAARAAVAVTFTEHVAPIVFANCASCHRPGEGAPFSLLSYADVKKRGRLIQEVVGRGYMPPWPPAKGWGHFQDERRLTEAQLDTIDSWVESGMSEGPKEKLPPLPKFAAGGWQLGTPDLIVTLAEPFDVPADGPDIYRMFALPLDLPSDRWVTAVEIRPTARSVVHHAIYFLDGTGASRRLDAAEPGPGFSRMGFPRTGTLGGWAVGATPRHLPMGLAYRLPKGSDLVVQVHFHPSGKAEREWTSFGLYFAKEAPRKMLLGTQAPLLFGRGTALRTRGILAGEKDFTIRGEWEVPFDIDLVSIGGHAHYLGKTMKAVAELPDGTEQKLFAIDDWDFNWQGRYNYAEPVRLRKGTIVRTTITYDNSADNPRNPSHPPVPVRWGEGSKDEMGSIGLAFVAVNEEDIAAYRGPSFFVGGGTLAGRFRALDPDLLRRQLGARDANRDGKLESDEIPETLRSVLELIDTNGDGALDREELRRLFQRMQQRRGGAAPDRGPETKDLDGRAWNPFGPEPGAKAQVLVFVTQDCPISNHFAPEIGRIAREYAAKSVPFLLVHVDPDLTPDAARQHAREYALRLPVLLDPEHLLVRRAGAKVTPEAAVVRPDGSVAYCGRIDDRFGKLGRQRPEPTTRDLRTALDAVLAGKPVSQPRVEAIGCPIENADD